MLPSLRYAGIIRGEPGNPLSSGRPEGLQDMAHLPELLNAIALLEGSPFWTQQDASTFQSWLSAYVDWIEREPVAIYARMMANYVGVNVDEQLIAAYLFLNQCAAALARRAWRVLLVSDLCALRHRCRIGSSVSGGAVGAVCLDCRQPLTSRREPRAGSTARRRLRTTGASAAPTRSTTDGCATSSRASARSTSRRRAS